ncbi:MAG: sensor domain-containing phosphodiesterase [Actinomycetota bacterium]
MMGEYGVLESFDVTLPAGYIAALSSAVDREGVLAATAEWVPRTIQAGLSSLALPIGEGRLKIMKLGEGHGSIIPSGSVFSFDGSLTGSAYTSGDVIKVDDLAETDYEESELLLAAGIRSALIGPMVSGGRCLGTINLGNPKVAHYTYEQCLLLGAIARLAGSYLNVFELLDDAEHRATYDELTGALTRRAGLAVLEQACGREDGQTPSIVYADLDNFKSVNDTHGHRAGDEVLRSIAGRILVLLGPEDHLVRLGGDEFLVIVQDDPSGERGIRVAYRLQAAMTEPLQVDSVRIEPHMSFGIAHGNLASRSAIELMSDADQAMYEAKQGGGVVVADDSIHRRAVQIASIDRDLDRAMLDGSLCFHYQPIRSLATGAITSAEALLRWRHPQHGWLPAPLIIGRVEATGRLERFTRWSLATAARDLHRLRGRVPGFADRGFSVNFTPSQLAVPTFVDRFVGAMDRNGLVAGDLIIEVVESEAIRAADLAEQTLRSLHALGVPIALDDFGTGHNALGYFTRLPLGACKFDRSLVGVMASNPAAHKILRSLAAMARDLGVHSIAEGIESETEERMALEAGVECGQGWHLSMPMPLDDLSVLVADEERRRAAHPVSAST